MNGTEKEWMKFPHCASADLDINQQHDLEINYLY